MKGYYYCAVCREPRESSGWCDRCKQIREDIAAALGESDTRDEREYTDVARRMEMHRGRARTFPKTNARGNRR